MTFLFRCVFHQQSIAVQEFADFRNILKYLSKRRYEHKTQRDIHNSEHKVDVLDVQHYGDMEYYVDMT